MSPVATIMSEETKYVSYATIKIDDEVLPAVKAAAALSGQTVQEWLSDLANETAAKFLNRKPVKRRPVKGRE